MTKFFSKHFYSLMVAGFFILNLLPFLAPVLAYLGSTSAAKFIYDLYSFTCHQFDWRSLHIFDYQLAWCVRDTFIWLSILTVAILVNYFKVKTIRWYWIIPFMIPIALDGGVQTIATILGLTNADPLYMSTNLMRMVTGTLFGTGLGLWMMPTLKDFSLEKDTRKKSLKPLAIAAITFAIMFIVYLGLVKIWHDTSPKNPPANFVDFEVKTPVNPKDWLIRRKDGV